MNLKVTKPKHISKESLDSLVDTYLHKSITHEAFIDAIILNQKRLIVSDLIREGDGQAAAGEVFIRRMENAGIEIVL